MSFECAHLQWDPRVTYAFPPSLSPPHLVIWAEFGARLASPQDLKIHEGGRLSWILLGPPCLAPNSADGTVCRFHDGKTEASAVACSQPGAYSMCPNVDSSVTWMGTCRSSRAPEVAGVPRALCSPDTDCPLAPSFQKCEVRRASGDRKPPGLDMGWHLCLQLQTLGSLGSREASRREAHPAGTPGLVL